MALPLPLAHALSAGTLVFRPASLLCRGREQQRGSGYFQEVWQQTTEVQCREFRCQGLETEDTKWILPGADYRGHPYGKGTWGGVQSTVTPEVLEKVCGHCTPVGGWKTGASSPLKPGTSLQDAQRLRKDPHHVLQP